MVILLIQTLSFKTVLGEPDLLSNFGSGYSSAKRNKSLFFVYFFGPLYPEIKQYNTMILQSIKIIAVDAGFEPGTSAPEVWRATNEPPLSVPLIIEYHGL